MNHHKNLIALLAATIFLAGCESREDARRRNEMKLPEGCRIVDLDYGDLTSAVICDGRKTTTSARGWEELVVTYQIINGVPNQTIHTIRYNTITAQIDGRSNQ